MATWNFKLVQEEALKYKTRVEFRKNSKSAFRWAFVNGKLGQICLHMIPFEVIEASKKYSSISQFEKGDYQNFKLAKKYNLIDKIPHFKKRIKWNYNLVKKEALKYETRSDFKEGSSSAYKWANLNKIIDEISSHMTRRNLKHTFNSVKNIALKYDTKKEFREKDSGAHKWMITHNKITEFCSHMKFPYIRDWTPQLALEEILKYDSFYIFKKKCKSCYNWIIESGNIEELTIHMKKTNLLKKEIILTKANNYTYIDFFIRDNYEDYLYSKEKKFKKELFEKMEYFKWDEESLQKEGERYSSIKELASKNYLAYKWYLNSNMRLNICKRKSWNYEKVFEKAQEFTTRKDFKKFAKGAHHWAQSRGFLDEVCEHMIKLNNCFDKHLSAILYYLYIEKDGNIAYKVGITNHTVEERFGYDMKFIRIVREISFSTGKKAYALEQEIMKDFNFAKYKGNSILYSGNTELFEYDILDWDIERRPSEYKFVNNKITDF